ncbi:MAG: hypothetical protein ACP5KN_18045 [Armatimonadota bacterium]
MTTNAGRARTWNNPTRGLPEPADASALWWYWPHALSERLADRTVSIGPARGALQEVLEASDQPLL